MQITGSIRELITMFGHNDYLFDLVNGITDFISDNAPEIGPTWIGINETMSDDAGYYLLDDDYGRHRLWFNVDSGNPEVQVEKLKRSALDWYLESNILDHDEYLNQELTIDLNRRPLKLSHCTLDDKTVNSF